MTPTRITDIAGLHYLWQVDNLFLAGQPAPESLEALKSFKFKNFVNLRSDGEGDFSFEKDFCQKNDLNYHHFPILNETGLDESACERLSLLVQKDEPIFIHCASANRVGGWLITHLVKYENMEFEQALDIASQSGLTNPGLIQAALKVVS